MHIVRPPGEEPPGPPESKPSADEVPPDLERILWPAYAPHFGTKGAWTLRRRVYARVEPTGGFAYVDAEELERLERLKDRFRERFEDLGVLPNFVDVEHSMRKNRWWTQECALKRMFLFLRHTENPSLEEARERLWSWVRPYLVGPYSGTEDSQFFSGWCAAVIEGARDCLSGPEFMNMATLKAHVIDLSLHDAQVRCPVEVEPDPFADMELDEDDWDELDYLGQGDPSARSVGSFMGWIDQSGDDDSAA